MWISTDILWYEKEVTLGSSETDERRSWRLSSISVCWLVPESRVLWKQKRANGWCRRTLLSSAVLLLLTHRLVSLMLSAYRSVPGCPQLWRHMSGCDHFVWKPGSGRFPSPLRRPVCSFVSGTLSRLRALNMGVVDLVVAGVERSVFLLRDSPWVSHEVTVVPHGQGCASQRVSPRRRPTATQMASTIRRADRIRWLEVHRHKASRCCVRLWKPTTLPRPSRMLHLPIYAYRRGPSGERPKSVDDELLCRRGMADSWQRAPRVPSWLNCSI